MRHVLTLAVLLVLAPPVLQDSQAAASAAPSMEERVAARRAVEDVLWRHRIWPADNPEPKPPLSAVLSDAEIRAKVIDDLRKSRALAEVWQRPVTAAMLQAELDRMAAGSRAPAVLEEMLAAVGHDPMLAREAIARPALVDRLIRSWYAQDARFHGELRRRAESGAGGTTTERTLRKTDPAWEELQDTVIERAGGRVVDEEDGYRRYTIRESTSEKLRFDVTSWPKRAFESWWRETSQTLTPDLTIASGAGQLSPQVHTPGSCANNTWHTLGDVTPSGRYGHSAVWTGAEMIVWGGYSPSGAESTGGRYQPATDSWFKMASSGAPSARLLHGAVWTGNQMVVWGGQQLPDTFAPLGTGGRYNPTTDSWQPTSTTNAPSPRQGLTVVWSGTRVIVWGGTTSTGSTNTGGIYEPVGDTWAGTSLTGAPPARTEHVAVWTATAMIVWGGGVGGSLASGGRYDLATDSWTPMSIVDCPAARPNSTAVWTGTYLVVWSGQGGPPNLIGGRYNPTTDTWLPVTTTGAPPSGFAAAAVWTGSRMIVWGGQTAAGPDTASGGSYDPVNDAWTSTATAGAPEQRRRHTAVWTGSEMIVWGGLYHQTGFPDILWYWNSGGRYSPATNSWVPTPIYGYGPPTARQLHSAVWTGSEAILWGGVGVSYFNDGMRYNAATNSWWPTTIAGAPSGREGHTAVWTGGEMVVWGGADGGFSALNSGGRYNPASDTWASTSLAGAPPPTSHHSAVWTGSRMILWGGLASSGLTSLGYRYDPGTDSWSAISSAGAPSAREDHTAVWTGSRMIVWGGTEFANTNDNGVNTGGRYDPGTDSWTPTTTAGAPQGRTGVTSAWTGSEMLVWGGACCFDLTGVQTGGRYNPTTNAWTAMATSGAPQARTVAQSVWTGSELVVWGGHSFNQTLNSGGRYLPSKDQWQGTNFLDAPAGRYLHTATWLGDKMLVWGGATSIGNVTNTGATYCACRVFWRDEDGDGYGNGDGGADTMETCNGTTPAGWVDNGGDCWDANPNVNPGRTDNTCNGIDDDCNGSVDDLWIGGLSQCGLGPCHAFGFFECVNGSVVNNCTPGTPNAPNDTACNGVDDDCDGGTDEDYVIRQDHWLPTAAAPTTRTNHSTVWTGSEVIVFGGDNGSGTVKVGGEAYAQGADTWRTLPAGPAKRWRHTAVWTGTHMIVWGGDDNIATVYNTGSRYDPGADTWSATTTTGAPLARGGHAAVWVASRMIIWGGAAGPSSMNTGSRYDPTANGWSATTTTGAPTARLFHSAVATSTEMIVWGGQNVFGGTALNTGSRYNPTSNTWSAVTTSGAPTTRYGHVAAWTGSEMIIWGGTDGSNYRATGSRYNPSTNAWTPMSTTGAPTARAFASFGWTGTELIIWGGTSATEKSDGARYNPSTDTWTAMTPEAPPVGRARASGAWAGIEFIVWGGDPNGAARSDGGRYSITTQCGNGGCMRTGASYCSGGVSGFQCVPAPSTPEVCDGVDNNCDWIVDNGIPAPAGRPVLGTSKINPTTNQWTWSASADAHSYDFIRGSLVALRLSNGDFSGTAVECLADNTTTLAYGDSLVPAIGDSHWYLSRPVNACSGPGSYDDPLPSQASSRDTRINMSFTTCP